MKILIKLFALSSILFTFTSCIDWFQGKIPMTEYGESDSLYGLLIPTTKITQLDTPAQISASQGRYSNKITISWSEVENATSYHLEKAIVQKDSNGGYSLPDDADFEVINAFVYKTTYIDTILYEPGANNEEYNYVYFYRVCAENISKGYDASEYTDFMADGYEGKGWLLCPPKNATATKGSSQEKISITWNHVEGATYYKIYRGTSSDGSGAISLATVFGNQTSYDNIIDKTNQGVEYYYKISAMIKTSSGYEESACGSLAMGYALKDGAPVAPSADDITISGLGITKDALTITWTANTSLSYNIYRNSSSDSVFTCVKSNYQPTNTAASYRDESVSTGQLYYYYLQSIKTEATGDITKSSFSDTGATSEKPAQGFLLSAPTVLDISDGIDEDSILLRWKPAVGADLVSPAFTYKIKRSDTADGIYQDAMLNSVTGVLDSEGYLTQNLPKYAFIRISTINGGVESVDSAAVAPQPAAPTFVEASKTKNLATEMGSDWKYNDYEVYPVKITWKKPLADNPASYNIYRSVKPAASFKKIATVEAPDDNPNTLITYYDSNETAKAGIFYYYKVVSVNSLGQGKKGNDPSIDDLRKSWGYGAITREQWFREYNNEIASSQAKLTLMHKPSDLDKVGSETIYADVPVNGSLGTLSYKAAIAGLGAEITMPYKQYADHYIKSDGKIIGPYFILNGNTDTTSNMSANGNMHETVRCYHYSDYQGLFQGMYPGYANYNNLQIKGGAAGGGYYLVQTYELDYTNQSANATVVLEEAKVDWLVGEEIRK